MDLKPLVPLLDQLGSEKEFLEKAASLKKEIEELGKESSAHFADVLYKDLPLKTQEDIKRFAHCVADTKVIHYGMVVKELLSKVDKHNFEAAEKHTKDEKVDEKEFYKKLPEKYILLVNDKICDGHHFLSKAKKLGVTSSLNVLDLTPVRFQEQVKTSSVPLTLWDVLKSKYSFS